MKGNISGHNIKQLRMQRGWTVEQAARQLTALGWECTAQQVFQMEEGVRPISDIDLLFYCKLYQVPVQMLLGNL